MQSYLFYDIETTGLNKAFDQVLHFAAIRTDMELRELDRYEIKIKLNPDMVPSPHAMITHYMGIEEILQGTSELDAMIKIHSWLNHPGTISVGYNTLGFDDEFLRFSFYRNLLPPYTHQYANRCARMDLYPIASMYYLYKPETITWPNIDGKPTLKLEHINSANNLIAGRSHHAMVDVEVTLALAQKFFNERQMWDYTTGYFNKRTDQDRFLQLPKVVDSTKGMYREGLMVDGIFGSVQNFQSAVVCLGEHYHYKNQTLWLRLDHQDLSLTTENNIADTTWAIRKKWSEPGFVLPTKERFLHHLNPERQNLIMQNKKWLTANPELFYKIADYYCDYTYPTIPDTDVEASLYLTGFMNDEDTRFCHQFHRCSPADKARLVENFSNPTLKALSVRILGRHFPEHLTPLQKQEYNEFVLKLAKQHEAGVIDFKGNKRLDAATALKDIVELKNSNSLNTTQLDLLLTLEAYLVKSLSLAY